MSRISKPISKKAGRVVRRTLADGTVKEYRYKAYKQKHSPRLEKDSVASLIGAFKSSPEWRNLAPRTVSYYLTYLKPLDFIGSLKASEVTRRTIFEMRDAIAEERGNGAANAFQTAAAALFAWATERHWIAYSPLYKAKCLPSGELQAWKREHAEVALSGLPERYRRVVMLGVHTGQRRGDLCALKWDAYDGERLTITQGKTGAVVVLTVPTELRVELDAWRAEASGDHILTNSDGRPWNESSLSTMLPKYLQKLGLPRGLNVHGMRKLFAAGMASAGATAHEIAANTGHATLSMVQLYTKTADQRRLSAGAASKIQILKTPSNPLKNNGS